MNLRTQYKQLERAALEQGWRIRASIKTQHKLWFSPDGKTIVTTGNTPSDHRAIKNARSMLRKGGLNV